MEAHDWDPRKGAAGESAVGPALQALDEAPDLALVVIDADLRIALAIGGLLAARGWHARDVVGRLVADVLPAEDAERIVPRYRAAIGGAPQRFEHRFASGVRCVIDVRPTGAAAHRSATILWRDVTVQREEQAAGRLSDERYRLLAENASDVLSMRTPDGRIVWISPSVRTVLGFDPEDLVGSYTHDLGHPDDIVAIRESHARLRAGGGDERAVVRARHVDGSYRWMETTQRAIPDPVTVEPRTVVLSARDVTDRVLAEHALHDSQERARTLLDSMADAAVLYDFGGDVIARSRRSSDLLGADDGALRLDTPESVVGWEDQRGTPVTPALHPAMLARLASGSISTVFSLRRPDGVRRWVRATASAVDAAQPSGSIVLTLFDITDLHDARVDLERSNDELRRMALVASHDLGAPLAMLRRELAAVAAVAAGELDGSAATRLRRAGEAADMMQEILGAVLAHAQVDGAAIEGEVVDVAALAAETRVILGAQIEATDAVLRVGELPAVVGDRVLLRRLLQSLVGNAMTHHPGPTPHIVVRSEHRHGTPVMIVEDDGAGIPASDRERVFALFARGPSPAPGHGIGLSTAKRIVELHGGRIWIEQAAPHGARFCMTLGTSPPPDRAPA